MSVLVVDASALGAVFFVEPRAQQVLDLIADEPLCAPALLPYELASIAREKCRDHPAQQADWLEGLREALAAPVELVPVDDAAVVQVALETGLTTYDASYLWLVREFSLRLVTLDRKLGRAYAPR